MPVTLNTSDPDFETGFAAMLAAKREDAADVGDAVAAIIARVRAEGDAALVELTNRFDRTDLTADRLSFTPAEIDAACAGVAPGDRAALELAGLVRSLVEERVAPLDATVTVRPEAQRRSKGWQASGAGGASCQFRRSVGCRVSRVATLPATPDTDTRRPEN